MNANPIHATVMFADIVGFTAMSAAKGPEQAYLVVTGCLKLLDSVARKHRGSVDKYQGDGVMAVFGYPVPLEHSARAAVDAALEMRGVVNDYNRRLEVYPKIELRIGINTGDMVAGDIQGPVIREFHVLGDTVNVAARLKARAPVGGIYVGPETHSATREAFEYRALEAMKLKGKATRVATFELREAKEAAGRRARDAMIFSALVGRVEELGLVRARVRAVSSGEGGIISLIGEEGIGKSRLLAELEASGAFAGMTLLRGAAGAAGRGQPYALFAELVRDLCGVAEQDDKATVAAKLSATLGPLAADKKAVALRGLIALLSAGRDRPGPRAGDEIAVGVAHLLRNLTAAQPVVIEIEDLHAADVGSLELLEHLLELSLETRALFLLSLQPPAEEPHQTLRFARSRYTARYEEIRLGPLSPEESGELIDGIVGRGALRDETRALLEERGRGNPSRLIMGAFLAPALRSEEERRENRSSEAERRRATILYADITGFTAMTEKLGPQRAYPIVAGCLQLLDEVARRHGGTVDKYLGDCVMALFGVPEAIEDAPRAAVNAAIEMRQRVREYNVERKLPLPLDIHVGINTGLGIAGDISGPLLREFAVMGEPVTVASELTDLAPPGRVYIGAETHRFTRDVFEFSRVEPAELPRGSDRSQSWELLSEEQQLYRARIGADRQVFSDLVGRDAELEALRRHVARTREGVGAIVTLIANAGVGKSRLVAELRASEEARGVSWREGRSLSNGQRLSFHPFGDLCRSWAEIDDADNEDQARRKLAETVAALLPDEGRVVFPFIATLLGMRLDAEQRERLERIQGDAMEKLLRSGMAQLLRRGSEQRPVVVVMDDLHWADLSSIELLESLLRLVEDAPILFLNVARPGFESTSERIRTFAHEHHAERSVEIYLEPLDADATRQLLNNLFSQGDIPHATRERIREQAGGNPFYIEEVVRALVDEGAVERRGGRFRATEKISSVVIPGTVQEVIMARVDRLDQDRKKLLQIASVAGRSFHYDLLVQIVGDRDALDRDLEALHAAEFLVPWDRLQGKEFAFKHPLIQEVTYDGILQTRREELHRDVAEAIGVALTEEIPGFFGMLAYHFSMGRDAERAEEFLFRAGDEAAKVAASGEALSFFQEASKLYFDTHGSAGDPKKKVLLEKNLARALFYRGQFIESVDHVNRALEFLGERIPRRQASLILRFARNMLAVLVRLYLNPAKSGRLHAATERQREVIALMFDRAHAQTTTSPTRFLFDSMDAVARLQRVDPSTVEGSAGLYANAVGIFAYGGVSYDISRRFLERAAALVDEQNIGELMTYRCMNFIHHVLEGDWSQAHEVEPELIEEGIREGALWEITTYTGLVAEKHIHRGSYSVAGEHMERIDKIWDLYQYDLAKTNHYYLRAMLARARREDAEALRAANEYYDENPEELLHISALGFRAMAQTRAGDRASAEETLERCAVLVAGNTPVPPFHLSNYAAARLLLDLANLEHALEHAGKAEVRHGVAHARKSAKAVLRSAAKVAWKRPETFRHVGRLHWLRGRTRDALRWWRRSLDAAERIDARAERARTQLEVGRRLAEARGRGRTFDGVGGPELLGEARKTFESLALVTDLTRVFDAEARLHEASGEQAGGARGPS